VVPAALQPAKNTRSRSAQPASCTLPHPTSAAAMLLPPLLMLLLLLLLLLFPAALTAATLNITTLLTSFPDALGLSFAELSASDVSPHDAVGTVQYYDPREPTRRGAYRAPFNLLAAYPAPLYAMLTVSFTEVRDYVRTDKE
jgi:hypothetical protein